MKSNNFLPMTREELDENNIDQLDIILISGDAYVDLPSFGTAVIGRVLEANGFKVGIIAQPDWRDINDFKKLGKPKLFFGISSGNVDSMIANYTANKKKRRDDDYSPNGKQGLRPNRALVVYANMARQAYKDVPIILGGIEASTRRLAYYDYWDDKVRRSIILDAKADLLVYGMGEKQIVEIANRLKNSEQIDSINDVRGTVFILKNYDFLDESIMLPSFKEVSNDKNKFNTAFKNIYLNQNPYRAKIIIQEHDGRFVIHNPPARPLKKDELDKIYDLPYQRKSHPFYEELGRIKAVETVKFSINSHRGCSGECSFCSLYFHQGRIVQSRSEQSILKEAKFISEMEDFKGTINDIGGPTANLFNAECNIWEKGDFCKNKSCLMPEKCTNLKIDYKKSIALYKKILALPKVKHLFISSGFRYDLFLANKDNKYFEEILKNHISGQMKVAPEHIDKKVLRIMNKPPNKKYEEFIVKFNKLKTKLKKNIFLVNYFILSHPGTSLNEAKKFKNYLRMRNIRPEQVQDYIPLPMSLSGVIYYTGIHPFTGEKIYVTKDINQRIKQRKMIQGK